MILTVNEWAQLLKEDRQLLTAATTAGEQQAAAAADGAAARPVYEETIERWEAHREEEQVEKGGGEGASEREKERERGRETHRHTFERILRHQLLVYYQLGLVFAARNSAEVSVSVCLCLCLCLCIIWRSPLVRPRGLGEACTGGCNGCRPIIDAKRRIVCVCARA
jgi:hypothetical protein